MAKSASKQQKTTEELEKKLTAHNKPNDDMVLKLQQQVANAFVLYLNYKHYHWQTFGPLFRDLHVLFDEFANEVYASIDVLAERVRMIGQNPVSRLEELADTASVTSAKSGTDMREMVAEAQQNALKVIAEMRAAIEVAEDSGDPGTGDILTKFVQIHEKHEWWLRDMLAAKDGLTR